MVDWGQNRRRKVMFHPGCFFQVGTYHLHVYIYLLYMTSTQVPTLIRLPKPPYNNSFFKSYIVSSIDSFACVPPRTSRSCRSGWTSTRMSREEAEGGEIGAGTREPGRAGGKTGRGGEDGTRGGCDAMRCDAMRCDARRPSKKS
jgi:hypothetical protein